MNKFIFNARFENLDKIREFVGQEAYRGGFSEKDIYAIQLAVDEASSNIIEHAYKGILDGKIEIMCQTTNQSMIITIHDHGESFDPARVPEPNIHADLTDRRIGGLGIYLMRKLMDEVTYQSSSENGNILRLIKHKESNG